MERQKIYGTKEGSGLVFMREFEDGKIKTLKFDFKDNSFYSQTKKGNWRLLGSQQTVNLFFKGLTTQDVIQSFEDDSYRKLLEVVVNGVKNGAWNSRFSNVGSFLQFIPTFQHMESWILQGIKFDRPRLIYSKSYYGGGTTNYYGIKQPVNIYQKEVLLFMKEISQHNRDMKAANPRYDHNVSFNEYWEDLYNKTEEFTGHDGLTTTVTVYSQIFINLCTFVRSNYSGDYEIYEWVYDLLSNRRVLTDFIALTHKHNLEYKALFNYLVDLERREAISIEESITLLRDYLDMNNEMGNRRAPKYAKLLKLRHDITVRNYNVDPEKVEINRFKKFIDYNLDWMDKDYAVVAPLTPHEMVTEGNKLHHCVAQYITKVVNGVCQIMFLRDLKDGNEPLITLEIREGDIVQVRGNGNRNPFPNEIEALTKFAKAKRLNYEQGGYDATEDRKNDLKKLEKKNNEKQNAECKEGFCEVPAPQVQYAYSTQG